VNTQQRQVYPPLRGGCWYIRRYAVDAEYIRRYAVDALRPPGTDGHTVDAQQRNRDSEDNKMDQPQTLKFTRRNLPHWMVADRTYFVTIRLKNTLPTDVLEQLRADRLKEPDKEKSRRDEFLMIERILDAYTGECLLDNPDVAAIVVESITWFEKKGWVIYAATILSTHIHLLMRN